jgi:hypothetical protein
MDTNNVVKRLQTAHPGDAPPFAPLPLDYAAEPHAEPHAADPDASPAASAVASAALAAPPPLALLPAAKPTIHTVAWAVTASQDGPFVDGAAVLMRAVQLAHPTAAAAASGRSAAVAVPASAYAHAFVAICHPEAARSRDALAALGWRILEVPEPVAASEIQGAFLKSHILKSGCCGARELLKL